MKILEKDIQAVLWDWDNTILMTALYYRKYALKFLNTNGIEISLDQSYKRWPVFLKEQVESELMEEYFFPKGMFIQYMSGAFDHSMDKKYLSEGVLDLLEKTSGIPNVIVSDGISSRINKQLKDLGLDSFFTNVLGRDNLNLRKPDPQVYIIGAESVGVDITKCLVIDDHVLGVKAGVESGATSIWLQNKLFGEEETMEPAPYKVIKSISEII